MARQARWRVGFEATSRCHPGRKTLEAGDGAVTFEGMSPIEALDGLLQLSPQFRWRRSRRCCHSSEARLGRSKQRSQPGRWAILSIEGASTLRRPRGSRSSATILVDTAHRTGCRCNGKATSGSCRWCRGGVRRRHLLEALNAIVGSFEGMWQVGYTGKTFGVCLHTFEFQDGSTTIPGHLRCQGIATP